MPLVLWLLVFTPACGKKAHVPTAPVVPGWKQDGLATWYGRGDGYDGKITAGGEKFDMDKLTAAHYDLPFGSRVRVTNKKNGKHVVVRINDRLSLSTLQRGRIIDLSYKAARSLDMIKDGLVPVTVELLAIPR